MLRINAIVVWCQVQSERTTSLNLPIFVSQNRGVRWGERDTAPGHIPAPPPRLWPPRSRRVWGGIEGSVEQRIPGGGSFSFWSCLHTSRDGELTASRL